jgi:hypothetical protein
VMISTLAGRSIDRSARVINLTFQINSLGEIPSHFISLSSRPRR